LDLIDLQEGVAIEVAEAVVTALKGELSANTVNAPMVAPEVLASLQPYITLAQGLGKVAVQLVAEQGFTGTLPHPSAHVLDQSVHTYFVS
jgi:D-3-phosphoglycerate dehydrogenase